MTFTKVLTAIALGLSLSAAAQSADTAAKQPGTPPKQPNKYYAEMEAKQAESRVQTFYLTNVSQRTEADEILVAIRNILPSYIKIYLVDDRNAIVIDAAPDDLATAQKLIAELDRPRKTYRLTYTLTEVDGDKRVGTEHFSMVVVTGQETTLRQGSKVPFSNYSPNATTPNSTQPQFSYFDVGLNFDATLDEDEHGARLRSKVEQSSIAPDSTLAQDPIVRQTVLQGTSFLTLGKPLLLGSVDIPGTTRHMDIEVVMEQVQ